MQLTKGQKDALVRKVMAIIEKKKEAKREELRKDYKPSKEAKEMILRLGKLFDARKKFMDTIEELGFRPEYSYIQNGINDKISFQLRYTDNDTTFDFLADRIRDNELGETFNSKFTYPDEWNVTDDIELLNLGKSFDSDAFLKKYEEL